MEGARGRWSPKRGPLAGIETRFLRSYSLPAYSPSYKPKY